MKPRLDGCIFVLFRFDFFPPPLLPPTPPFPMSKRCVECVNERGLMEGKEEKKEEGEETKEGNLSYSLNAGKRRLASVIGCYLSHMTSRMEFFQYSGMIHRLFEDPFRCFRMLPDASRYFHILPDASGWLMEERGRGRGVLGGLEWIAEGSLGFFGILCDSVGSLEVVGSFFGIQLNP